MNSTIGVAAVAAFSISWAAIGASSASTLLIAEGVIPYLSNGVVGGLAEELHAVPGFASTNPECDRCGSAGKRNPNTASRCSMMQFCAGLFTRPRKNRQTQIDGRGIERVDTPIARRIGVGESVAGYVAANFQMVELCLAERK
jgi:hypothetical protein